MPRKWTAEFAKQPWEELFRSLDHTRNLDVDGGEVISSGTISVFELDVDGEESTDVSATMAPQATVVIEDGTVLLYFIKAGSTGKDYDIRLRVVTSSGNKMEDDILMHVEET